MGARCGRCYDALLDYMERPEDTDRDRQVRRVWFPVSCIWPFQIYAMVMEGSGPVFRAGCLLGFVGLISCQMVMLLRVRVRYDRLVAWAVLANTLGILAVDLVGASMMKHRAWQFLILVMDTMLIVEADLRLQATVICMALACTAAVAVERGALFGLFELARWGEDMSYSEDLRGCDHPPCKSNIAAGVAIWLTPLVVVMADFHMTRSFAVRLRRQLNLYDTTVLVAQRIAQLSADYDITEARKVVEEEGEALSEPLRTAYIKLLINLERYRAFLPAGLLAEERDLDSSSVSEQTQLLPQLESELTRGALVSVLAEATEYSRVQAEAVMAERFEACLVAGDAASARYLLQSGWHPPDALMEQFFAILGFSMQVSDMGLGSSAGNSILAGPRRGSHSTSVLRFVSFEASHSAGPLPGVSRRFSASVDGRTLDSQGGSALAPARKSAPGRFGDGADEPAGMVATTELWPPEYEAPSASDAVADLVIWHDPRGITYWPSETIGYLVEDFDLLYGAASGPSRKHIGLYIYSVEINQPVVWAGWQGKRWRRYPDQDMVFFVSPEARAWSSPSSATRPSATLQLDADDMRAIEMDLAGGCRVELMEDTAWGLTILGTGGAPRLLRYENKMRGDPEMSPLSDTALWAPPPDTMVAAGGVFSHCRGGHQPPPPGIIEHVTSRDFRSSHTHREWSSVPFCPDSFRDLHRTCLAQKNQQRAKEKLCQLAKHLFNSFTEDMACIGVDTTGFATALPVLHQAKCVEDSPTPAQIAHACELGVLQWRGSRVLLALTGVPRIAVPLDEADGPSAVRLSRVSREYETGQPYALMNAAMRSQQSRDYGAALQLRGGALCFAAGQPSEPPTEPSAALFVSTAEHGAEYGATAQWAGQDWALKVADRSVTVESQGALSMGAWGLPQFRALIWHIDRCLADLPRESGGKRSKGYRGLQNVTLSRSVYSRGKIVVFAAFTSTSADQGVASGYALGTGAAVVFTMFTCTGRDISGWSRFAREKEVLLRPNSLHLVTEALSAEHAAIMDKEALQVFDLREVTKAEAVRHLAKEGALAISRDHPSVLRQAELAAAAAERGNWVGALRELLAVPDDTAAGGGESRFVRSIVPRSSVGVVSLVCSSPAGPELGAGIEVGLWNDFFTQTERCAAAHSGTVTATPLGHVMVQLVKDGEETTAAAAVELAEEIMEAMNPSSAELSPPPSPCALGASTLTLGASASDSRSHASGSVLSTSPLLGGDLFSPAAPVRRRSRRQTGRGRPSESMLQVHVGITVGTVHGGFGGSAQHRVEIADGPAVRRAFRMAAYSRRYALKEMVTDVACTAPAARAGYVVWTVDLVSFDSERDMREPLTCIERGKRSGTHTAAASAIEEAWEAVVAVAAGGPSGAAKMRHLRDCVACLPQSSASHRVARALQDAAEKPATYCCDLDALA